MVWIRGEAKTVCSVYVAVSAGAADKASVYGCLLLCWCIEYYIPNNDLKQGVTDGNSHKFVLYTEMRVQEHQPNQWNLFFKCSLFNILA